MSQISSLSSVNEVVQRNLEAIIMGSSSQNVNEQSSICCCKGHTWAANSQLPPYVGVKRVSAVLM